MTDNEIVVKTEAIAAVLAEYMAYYKPIYERSIDNDVKRLKRNSRRKAKADAMKDFHVIHAAAIRFSGVLEKLHNEHFDGLIDALHDGLSKIEVVETKTK